MDSRPDRIFRGHCKKTSVLAISAVLATLAQSGAAQTATIDDLYDTAVFRTLHLTFLQNDWWNQLLNNKASEIFIKADLVVGQTRYPDVGVRLRGGSSFVYPNQRNSKKLPFRIALDEFVAGQRLQGRRSLILNNGLWDPTFMREVMAMEVLREFIPAPRANWVKLMINGESWGVYINMEAPNRDFLDRRNRWFRVTSGNRYKGDHLFQSHGTNPKAYMTEFPLASKGNTNAYKDLAAALSTMDDPNLSSRVQAMENKIDIDLALRTMAGNAVLGNLDAFPFHNYYIYADPFHGRLAILTWDANMAWLAFKPIERVPLIFADTPEWRETYTAYLRDIGTRVGDWNRVSGVIAKYQSLIDAAVKADPKRLYPYEMFHKNLTEAVYADVLVIGIKQACDRLQADLATIPELRIPSANLESPSHYPSNPTYRNTIKFAVKAKAPVAIDAVSVHYRFRGSFRKAKLFDDGKHGDGAAGDGLFAASVPPLPAGSRTEYYFSARTTTTSGSTLRFLPPNGAHEPFRFAIPARHDSVLIHEFVADNDGGLRDNAGEDDDWLELINPSDNPVSVGGMYVSDDPALPTRWRIPANTVIPAHGTLLVWADGQPAQGPLHANFKLSSRGESLTVFDTDGMTMLDEVEFGPQAKNVSTGRLSAAGAKTTVSPWVTFPRPTPRSANDAMPNGWLTFNSLTPRTHLLRIDVLATPRLGQHALFYLEGATSMGTYIVFLSGKPANVPVPGTGMSLLFDAANSLAFALSADDQGRHLFAPAVPVDPRLAGLSLVMQALSMRGNAVQASNGVRFVIRR